MSKIDIKPLIMQEHKFMTPVEVVKGLKGLYYKFMFLVSEEIIFLDKEIQKLKDIDKKPTIENIKNLSLHLEGIENLKNTRTMYLSQYIFIIEVLKDVVRWEDLKKVNFNRKELKINPVIMEYWKVDKDNFKELSISFYNRSKKNYKDLKNK